MTPYTEHRRAMNRLVLEEARKHQTSRCPVCNKRQYKVFGDKAYFIQRDRPKHPSSP